MGIVSAMMQVGAAIKHALFKVTHSLRFDGSGDYLLSSQLSAGGTNSRTTFTISAWVRMHSQPAGVVDVLSAVYLPAPTNLQIGLLITSALDVRWFEFDNSSGGTYPGDYTTSTSPISVGSWHHIVCQVDTTAASSADRVKIWVDGSAETLTETAAYSANYTTLMSAGTWPNTSVAQKLSVGAAFNQGNSTPTRPLPGQLAEIHFIDGTAYDASYFGETNTNSQWVPKEVTGVTYGNNGFHLDFADSSTASALGTDASTNSNNFTVPANTLTPDDQLIDSPNLRFASWDAGHKDAAVTLTDANLTISAAYRGTQRGTGLMTAGKWYWETLVSSTPQYGVAIVDPSFTLDADLALAQSGSKGVGYWTGGQLYDESGLVSSTGASYTTGDVVAIAVDFDSTQKNAKFYKAVNGSLVLQYTYNFGDSNLAFSSGAYPAWNHSGTSVTQTATVNFGQDHTFAGSLSPLTSPYTDDDGNGEFYYQPPSGFKALATSY